MKFCLGLLVSLFLIAPASAEWTVDYSTRGDASQLNHFYGPGAYLFLKAPDSIPVYLQQGGWSYIGLYGAVSMPDGIPHIAFTGLYDQAVATPVVATPELRVLRQLGSHYGPRMASMVNPALQRATAIGATGALKAMGLSAIRTGDRIALPSVTLDVIEWCSGLYTMKLLTLFAAGVAICVRRSWTARLVLVLVAPLIGLEINALRVAGVGLGYEVFSMGWAVKEWAGWVTLALGAGQVLGLGWLLSARASAPDCTS